MRVIPFLVIYILALHAECLCFNLQMSAKFRKKRSLVVPKGTMVQLVYCYLMSAMGTDEIFTIGVTLGTNWEVPENVHKLSWNEITEKNIHRRDRRSLYPKIEFMLDQLGINGRKCLKNMLCAAKNRLKSIPHSFAEEIIYAIFNYPSVRKAFEPADMYDFTLENCGENSKDCYARNI